MKTIFDNATKNSLLNRIQLLDANSKAAWGSMTVYQMLRHCILAEEMYLGKKIHKRALLGRLLGKTALKSLLKNDVPMPKNAKTRNAFLINERKGDVEAAKQEWTTLINQYEAFDARHSMHWFFGKMTKEQVGQLVYKHADHHLRQFGC